MAKTAIREFRTGEWINHPRFGKGQVGGSTRADCVTVRFEVSDTKFETKLFKKDILASVLAGNGVPYRDRHPIGHKGEVCVAPAYCDEPGHHGRIVKPARELREIQA